eukprot:Em0016g513a
MDGMEVLDASDGELAPHTDDDVQESERIGEVGENESETSVCMGVDDFCSDGGRSSGCMDARGGERDAGGDGGSSDGDDSDRGDGDSSDCSQDWAMEAGMCSGSDIVPNAHGNSGRAPHHALSQLDKLTVVKFIKNYAAVHALPDPGRLQGKTRDFVLGGIKHSLENEGQVALPVSMYEVRGDHIYSVDAPQKARLSLARGEAGLFACMNFFVMEGCTPLSKDHITNLLVMAGGKIVSNPQKGLWMPLLLLAVG